jgi:hypothetical protein
MSITSNKKRTEGTGSFQLKVGLAEVEVSAINPSREELNELLGKEDSDDDKEIEYQKEVELTIGDTEKKEKFKSSNIVFWVAEVKTGTKFPIYFTLIDRDVVSKSGKTQYINSVGDTAYAESEDNLPDFFTHFTDFKTKVKKGEKSYREAIMGEEQLYAFLKSWLKFDFWDPSTEVILDKKKLMKGNVKELTSLIDTDDVGSVVISVEIKTKEVEGEVKEYQTVNNKVFLPGSYMKTINLKAATKPKALQRFVDSLSGEYGSKNYYILEPLRDYDSSENIAGSTEPKKETSSSDSDY